MSQLAEFSAAQDRLSIPQETKLKAAYISLTPNDEHPHPDNGSVEALSAGWLCMA